MTSATTQKYQNLHEYKGDLLEASVDVIAHQCNVMSKGVSGLAVAIFAAVPESNTYAENPEILRYGTWRLFTAVDQPYKNVLNIYGQVYPGHPSWGLDSSSQRLMAFRSALSQFLGSHVGVFDSLAIPKNIGCGLAGGYWPLYRDVIIDVAQWYPDMEFHIIEKS